MIVCVSDATNLKLNLRLVLEVKRLGLPMMLALNMTDLARKRGITIDVAALQRELDMPVVNTIAVRRGGASDLLAELESAVPAKPPGHAGALTGGAWLAPDAADVTATQREVRRILAACVREPAIDTRFDERIDRVVLHPVWGLLILAATLFLMFQAVFSLGQAADGPDHRRRRRIRRTLGTRDAGKHPAQPAGRRHHRRRRRRAGLPAADPDSLPVHSRAGRFRLSAARSLPARPSDGHRRPVRALVHSAAVELRLRHSRHHGDARTISNWRDRLATIMIAPLMTCSARLPVYALLIGAFIPETMVAACSTCRAWCCSFSTSPASSARWPSPGAQDDGWPRACSIR
jgi:ferrous iron transport protein B